MNIIDKHMDTLKNDDQPGLCLEAFLEIIHGYISLSETEKHQMIDNILKNDANGRYVYRKLVTVVDQDEGMNADKKMHLYLNLLKKKSPADVIRASFESIVKAEEPKGQTYMIDGAIRLLAKNINSDASLLGDAMMQAAGSMRGKEWMSTNASTARTVVNHPNADTNLRSRVASYFRYTPEFEKLAPAYGKDVNTPLGYLIGLEANSPGSILDEEVSDVMNKLKVREFLKNSSIKTLQRLNDGEFNAMIFPEIFNFEKKEIEKECFTDLLSSSDEKNIDKNLSIVAKYFKGAIPNRIAYDRNIENIVKKARARPSIDDEVREIIPSALASEDNEMMDLSSVSPANFCR